MLGRGGMATSISSYADVSIDSRGSVMVSLKTPTEITTVVRIRTKNSRSSLRATTTQGAHRHPGCRASAFSTGDGKPWCSTEEANRYVVAFGLPALVARSSKPETGRAHITSQLRNAVERAPFYPGLGFCLLQLAVRRR